MASAETAVANHDRSYSCRHAFGFALKPLLAHDVFRAIKGLLTPAYPVVNAFIRGDPRLASRFHQRAARFAISGRGLWAIEFGVETLTGNTGKGDLDDG